MQSIYSDYDAAQLQAQATQDALTDLTISPSADLPQAYYVLYENIEKMLKAGDKLVQYADAMHGWGTGELVKEQFATACPVPHQPQGQRNLPNFGIYSDAIANQGWEVKRAYRDYEFDLSQIRLYLSTGVDPARLNTLTVLLRKASVDGNSLQNALDATLDAMSRAKIAKAQSATGV